MPFANVDTASSGANTIVAAVTGKRIRLVSAGLSAAGAVTVKWVSGSTDLTGAMTLATGTPYTLAAEGVYGEPRGYLETASGEALVLTLGSAVQVSGHIGYELILG